MPEITLHVIRDTERNMTAHRPDRRNLTRRQALLHRDACQRILRRLLEAGVLREIQRGVYTPTALISGLPTP